MRFFALVWVHSMVHSTQPSLTSKGVLGITPTSISGRRNPPPPALMSTEGCRWSTSRKVSIFGWASMEVYSDGPPEILAVPRPRPSGMCFSMRSTSVGFARVTSPAQCPSGSRTSMRSRWLPMRWTRTCSVKAAVGATRSAKQVRVLLDVSDGDVPGDEVLFIHDAAVQRDEVLHPVMTVSSKAVRMRRTASSRSWPQVRSLASKESHPGIS